MEIKKLHLKTGDILQTANRGFISRGINFFQTLHSGEAEYSHTALVYDKNACSEQLWRTTRSDMAKYDNAAQKVSVWRIPLSEREREKLRKGIDAYESKVYGITKIPLFMADSLVTSVKRMFGRKDPCFFFTRVVGISNIPVCSQYAVRMIHKHTKYRFRNKEGKRVNWRKMSPDYLDDLLHLEHNKAKNIAMKPYGGTFNLTK